MKIEAPRAALGCCDDLQSRAGIKGAPQSNKGQAQQEEVSGEGKAQLIMAKFIKHIANEDGWSDDVQPVMKGYKLACCDCGLVHDMDFTVLRVTSKNPDGTWNGKELDPKKYRVEFRCRRNNRSTGQIRRRQNIELVKAENEE